jgi:hypothetical protein
METVVHKEPGATRGPMRSGSRYARAALLAARLGLTATLIAVCVPTNAVAEPARLAVAFEVWVGETSPRTPADDHVRQVLAESFKRRQVEHRNTDLVFRRIAGSGDRVSPARLNEYEALVADGQRLLKAATKPHAYAQARDVFLRAAALEWEAALPFATQPALRESLRLALIGLAVSEKRLGQQQAADDALRELVRLFGDRDLKRDEFGSEFFADYQRVKTQLAAVAPGALVVILDDPKVTVYVDGRYVGVGAVRHQLPPGRHLVLLRKGVGTAAMSRSYSVDVASGQPSNLPIRWSFERLLEVNPSRCCLIYPDETTRDQRLPDDLRDLVRKGRLSRAVAYWFDTNRDTRVLRGVVQTFEAAAPERMATLAVDPEPAPVALDQLAAYWAGKVESNWAELDGATLADAELAASADTSTDRGPVPYLVLGVGVALLGTGATLYAIDQDCVADGPCDAGISNYTYRDSAPLGVGLATAGLVTIGAGAYLWFRRSPTHSTTTVSTHVRAAPLVWSSTGGGLLGVIGHF